MGRDNPIEQARTDTVRGLTKVQGEVLNRRIEARSKGVVGSGRGPPYVLVPKSSASRNADPFRNQACFECRSLSIGPTDPNIGPLRALVCKDYAVRPY